jgi:hypothetical protein
VINRVKQGLSRFFKLINVREREKQYVRYYKNHGNHGHGYPELLIRPYTMDGRRIWKVVLACPKGNPNETPNHKNQQDWEKETINLVAETATFFGRLGKDINQYLGPDQKTCYNKQEDESRNNEIKHSRLNFKFKYRGEVIPEASDGF